MRRGAGADRRAAARRPAGRRAAPRRLRVRHRRVRTAEARRRSRRHPDAQCRRRLPRPRRSHPRRRRRLLHQAGRDRGRAPQAAADAGAIAGRDPAHPRGGRRRVPCRVRADGARIGRVPGGRLLGAAHLHRAHGDVPARTAVDGREPAGGVGLRPGPAGPAAGAARGAADHLPHLRGRDGVAHPGREGRRRRAPDQAGAPGLAGLGSRRPPRARALPQEPAPPRWPDAAAHARVVHGAGAAGDRPAGPLDARTGVAGAARRRSLQAASTTRTGIRRATASWRRWPPRCGNTCAAPTSSDATAARSSACSSITCRSTTRSA